MLFIAAAATTFGSSAAGLPAPPPIWLAVYSVFVLGFAAFRGLYGTRLRYELLEELRAVLVVTSLATVPVLLLRGLLSDPATSGPRGSAPGPSRPPTSPRAASRSTGHARRRTATASRPADADHRRRQGRQARGCAAPVAAPARAQADRLPGQGAAGSPRTTPCRFPSSAPAGTSTGSWRSTASSRCRHLLPRAPRGAAPAREALRGARRPGGFRAAAVREDDEPADRSSTSAACRSSRPARRIRRASSSRSSTRPTASSRSACSCSLCP